MSDQRTMHVISLGAGVQSSVMLLMAQTGELAPKPELAIFADTGWEPPYVYQHLSWLQEQTDIPIRRVSNGHNLYQDTWDGLAYSGKRFTEIPVFVMDRRGNMKLSKRQCTEDYKIRTIRNAVRDALVQKFGRLHGSHAVQWIGISKDEALRMKDSPVGYVSNHYPLVEAGLRRSDCLAWFRNRYPDRPLQKSSCVGCPYHSDAAWLELYQQCSAEMEAAIRLDERLRNPARPTHHNSSQMPEFLHRSGQPLRDVLHKLEQAAAEGQQISLFDHFNNECEGHCGL